MYTHLLISKSDSEIVFLAMAKKPLKPGECGAVTEATLEEHFAKFSQTYMEQIDAILEKLTHRDCFVLKFRRYLTEVPTKLIDLKVEVLAAEIVRYGSAPTRAIAGYYSDPKAGMTAIVERVFPDQRVNSRIPEPLYAQHITVTGRSLADVRKFNAALSQGHCNRHLVDRME